ncbi:MAG: FG-GAP repeat protein [Gammaproteobacteria bacterium]|nr:FG-GAP repeat protein [Gammaproteobacteria bacterium]
MLSNAQRGIRCFSAALILVLAGALAGCIEIDLSMLTMWSAFDDGEPSPDPFSFTGRDGVDPGVMVRSDPVTITGFKGKARVGMTYTEEAYYAIDGGPCNLTEGGYVKKGQRIAVCVKAPAGFLQTEMVSIVVGKTFARFTVTTRPGHLETAVAGSKRLRFSWEADGSAHHYRLLENADGQQGFVPVQENIDADKTSVDFEIPAHLLSWEAARYQLEVCAQEGNQTCRLAYNEAVTSDLNPIEAIGYIKASNASAVDMFGYATAISDDGGTLAVGAMNEDSGGAKDENGRFIQDRDCGEGGWNCAPWSGAVYLFGRDDESDEWAQQAFIKASNTGSVDQFGRAVALSKHGNTLAVGATGESSAAGGEQDDCDSNNPVNCAVDSGAVYVFSRNAYGEWVQQAYLKASNIDARDEFGHALALSDDGNVLIVGAPKEDSGGKRDGDGNLIQKDDCSADIPNCAHDSGALYVFRREGEEWTQSAYIKAFNVDHYDEFGFTLSVNAAGDVLAVGSPKDDNLVAGSEEDDCFQTITVNCASDSGAVHILKSNLSGLWEHHAYIKASNVGYDDEFGAALDLSADGATLAVGARLEASDATGINGDGENNAAFESGAAYIYTAGMDGSWSDDAVYIKASNTDERDLFGYSVGLNADGSVLAVGSRWEDSGASGIDGEQGNAPDFTGAGAVYVYRKVDGYWNDAPRYIKASNTDRSDGFGASIALSADGNTLVVGAEREDSGNGDPTDNSAELSGAVYVY